jgi:hypothetical protein
LEGESGGVVGLDPSGEFSAVAATGLAGVVNISQNLAIVIVPGLFSASLNRSLKQGVSTLSIEDFVLL